MVKPSYESYHPNPGGGRARKHEARLLRAELTRPYCRLAHRPLAHRVSGRARRRVLLFSGKGNARLVSPLPAYRIALLVAGAVALPYPAADIPGGICGPAP